MQRLGVLHAATLDEHFAMFRFGRGLARAFEDRPVGREEARASARSSRLGDRAALAVLLAVAERVQATVDELREDGLVPRVEEVRVA